MNYSVISRRFWAWFFDNAIIAGILYGVLLVLRMSGMSIFPVEEIIEGNFSSLSKFYLIYAMIYLTYEISFLSSNLSATPGKIIMEMEVACAKASFLKVIIRSVAKFISAATGLYLIFFTIAMFNEKKQAVHDLLAGSFVIDQERENQSAMDLTQDITKTEAFYEEMKSRGIKTFSEQKALAEEMYGKASKSSKSSILSSSIIWVLVLVVSFGFSFIGSKVLVSDMISEMKILPQFKNNGVKVEQSIAEKYVGAWANDKRTVGFTVYYDKKNSTMYINTSNGALKFMFDNDDTLYIFEGENKFKFMFSDGYYTAYMTCPINGQLEYKEHLKKE